MSDWDRSAKHMIIPATRRHPGSRRVAKRSRQKAATFLIIQIINAPTEAAIRRSIAFESPCFAY